MNFYNLAQKFTAEYIEPVAKQLDSEAIFPEEIFKLLGKNDFLSLIIPESMGGLGKGYIEHTEVVKALSESNPSIGLIYMMHNVALSYVLNYGSEKLKNDVVADVLNNNAFLARAATESSYGVDMSRSEFKLKKENKNYVLSGKKHMVTGGDYASWYMTSAPAIDNPKQILQLYVPLKSEGLTFELQSWDPVGMRSNLSVPMILEDVMIPEEYCLSLENMVSHNTKNYYFTLGLAAVYSGINTTLYKESLNHAINRKYPDGTSLSDIESIKIHLSKLYINDYSSAATLWDASQAASRNDEDAETKVSASRVVASDNAIESSNIAMTIGGGKAYAKANKIERFMRDAYAGPVMTPSSDVLRLSIVNLEVENNK